MQLLNLDELVDVKRQVTIGGSTYDVVAQTVGEMIEAIQTAKEVEKHQDDPEVIFNSMIRTARRLIPACPEEILNRLQVRQLVALIEFATASDNDVVAAAAADEAPEQGKTQA